MLGLKLNMLIKEATGNRNVHIQGSNPGQRKTTCLFSVQNSYPLPMCTIWIKKTKTTENKYSDTKKSLNQSQFLLGWMEIYHLWRMGWKGHSHVSGKGKIFILLMALKGVLFSTLYCLLLPWVALGGCLYWLDNINSENKNMSLFESLW